MHVTVLGAARSGRAAAILAKQLGATVFLSESKSDVDGVLQESKQHGYEVELGGHTEKVFDADVMVVSPGVAPSHPIRVEAQRRGLEVIGELEFASRHVTNTIVAVTGTNGKTTTTALITHILNESGRGAVAVGNIGTPLSSIVSTIDSNTVLVCETSSYQLESTVSFRPTISIILNITPDHLSYHGSFEHYVHSKWKIFANQREDDVVLLNADDEHVMGAHPHVRCNTAFFSTQREVNGAFVRGGEVVFRDQQQKEEILMPTRRLGLAGLHNEYNSLASALATRNLELRNENIRDSLSSFTGVEHRMELVRTIGDVRWVNDSKATNINAAWYALSSYDRPIVWIAGGRADDNDYAALDDLVSTNVKAIVCIGEEADTIFNHWCTQIRCEKAATLQEAVHKADDFASDHDIVLLSPACKSFDMFESFEDRGNRFKELVNSF